MKTEPPTIHLPQKLDVITLDGVFRQCLGCGKPPRQRRCNLDLSAVRFVDPGGLTGLAQAVAYLRAIGWTPSLEFPTESDVGHYLVRMGLRRALKGHGICRGAPRGKRRYSASTALLEVGAIEAAEDIESLLGRLSERVASILETELGYSPGDVGNFCNVISELCRNVIDHSGSVGFVAAQRYTGSDRDRFAVISVGDVGVGLRATLGQRYPVESWTDAEVLTRALLPAYSRHPNRGLGLTFVKKVSFDYRGSLHLRSGSSRIYIRGKRIFAIETPPFPGTQVVISLKERERT